MNILQELLNLIEERTDVHAALKAAGLKDVTHNGMERYERKYNADKTPEEMHKLLTSNGYEMVTHYKSDGKPFPKYEVYEDPKFNGGRVQLHKKNGKVYYVSFDYRQTHD